MPRCIWSRGKEDGSKELVDYCSEHGLPVDLFRVVGVTADDCVAKTASGLVGRLSDCTRKWSSQPAHAPSAVTTGTLSQDDGIKPVN